MLLRNLQTINGDIVDIDVKDSKISAVGNSIENLHTDAEIHFDDHIVFPGLINSHDHLDFNLFPKLGNKKYHNYTEWGAYIHKEYKDKIDEVLKVPEELRIQWGIYKNLLCGVTTVINHGKKISAANDLLTVYQDCQSIHSVAFEKK